MDLICAFNEEMGVSVLLIERDVGLVTSIAPRVVVVNVGSAIAAGTPAEVRATAAVVEPYLGAA